MNQSEHSERRIGIRDGVFVVVLVEAAARLIALWISMMLPCVTPNNRALSQKPLWRAGTSQNAVDPGNKSGVQERPDQGVMLPEYDHWWNRVELADEILELALIIRRLHRAVLRPMNERPCAAAMPDQFCLAD